MTGPTHLVAGVASLALPVALVAATGSRIPPEAFGSVAVGALLGSLTPDLDAPASTIRSLQFPLNPTPGRGRRKNSMLIAPFALPARLLNKALGHRTLLHSLSGFVLVALSVAIPLGMVYGFSMALGFLLGYLSHLALDACTVSGIPLWHANPRRFHLLPRPLLVTTGSPEESIVFAIASGMALFALVAVMI